MQFRRLRRVHFIHIIPFCRDKQNREHSHTDFLTASWPAPTQEERLQEVRELARVGEMLRKHEASMAKFEEDMAEEDRLEERQEERRADWRQFLVLMHSKAGLQLSRCNDLPKTILQ